MIEEIESKMSAKKYDKKEIMLNKFIQKFPKTDLHTFTQINKYCNKQNVKLESSSEINDMQINYIYNYLEMIVK